MKKIMALVLAFTLAVGALATGCAPAAPAPSATPAAPSGDATPAAPAPTDAAAPASPAAPSDAPLKVALLLNGPVSDNGWNATAFASLARMEKELGAETIFQENIAQSDFEEVYRNFVGAGYNVIIGHGYQFGDAAKKVAAEFPDVKFALTSTDIVQEPNLASINNHNQQQGFLAGAFAALMSKSGIIGSVCGMDIPSIKAYERGYLNGAEYAVPGIKASVVSTGSFTDSAKAKGMAQALVDSGVDILAHDADAAGMGVVEAAKESKIPCIGAISDQYDLAPDVMIVSALSDLTSAIFEFVKATKEGQFEAKGYMMGIKENCVGLSSYHDFEDKVPAEVKTKMEDLLKNIADGTIDVNVGPGGGPTA